MRGIAVRRNREKFAVVVARIRDLKARFASQIEAAEKNSTSPEARRIPRLAAAVLLEGQWLASVCERKLVSNHHEISKADESKLREATEFFDRLVSENSESVAESGFIPHVDGSFVTHMASVAAIILRLDAESQARKAKALSLDLDESGPGDDGDDDDSDDPDDTDVGLAKAAAGA